jgi:hypothetical protein
LMYSDVADKQTGTHTHTRTHTQTHTHTHTWRRHELIAIVTKVRLAGGL